MAPENEAVDGAAGGDVDIQQVLAQALKNMADSNKLLQDQLNRLNNPVNHLASQKIDNCPIKRKYCNLQAWISEVKLWNESNVTTESGYAKKYLKLIQSVRDSEDCDDLKHLVQVEFVENEGFDKKHVNTIRDMLTKIKKKLGKTDLEKSTDAWLEFIDIKQKANEDTKDYVSRFEQCETKLRNVEINVPTKALAIQLLNRSTLSAMSKENVLTKVDTDDQNEMFEKMMKSMKEMKSNLTSTSENETFYGTYDRQSRYDQRQNSGFNRSKSRDNSKWGRSKSREYNRFNRSKSRDRPQVNGRSADSHNLARKSPTNMPDNSWRGRESRGDSEGSWRRESSRDGSWKGRESRRDGDGSWRRESRRDGSNSRGATLYTESSGTQDLDKEDKQ